MIKQSVHNLIGNNVLFKQLESGPDEERLEQGQALNRMGNIGVVVVYVIGASMIVAPDNSIAPWAVTVLKYLAVYTLIALGIVFLTKRFPGNYPARRIFSMVNDYVALAFTIIHGCNFMLPLYATIVWVTLGNGIRFGKRYLMIAAAMAQVTLLAIFALTPRWQVDPIVALTLSLTAIIIPIYARSLLVRNEEARRAAVAASLAKSRFLAQASHDLRQPVHALGLFLNSLKQTGLDENQLEIVGRIDRSLQGVSALFRSLLDISTLDSGGLESKPELFSIEQLFVELEQQNRERAQWAGVDLRFVPSRFYVFTDRALLTTMVQNLISNSIKYAPGGSILVGCRQKNGTLSILVCDRGEGIAPEHIPHLFEEFYQVRKLGDSDAQGVGLGLAIVERVGTLLGLHVSISSQVGHGTTATIGRLHLATPNLDDEKLVEDRRYPNPLSGMRIVLVEDDRDVLDATADLLRSWGCVVQGFATIPFSAAPCDLIITDFDIGRGTTGADCIAAIRKLQGQWLPAIVMTGHDETQTRDLLADRSIPVFKKPVSPAQLRSTIGAVRLQCKMAA